MVRGETERNGEKFGKSGRGKTEGETGERKMDRRRGASVRRGVSKLKS